MSAITPVFVTVDTTDLSSGNVVRISAYGPTLSGGHLEFNTFVKPPKGVEIAEHATDQHGIDRSNVSKSPQFKTAWTRFTQHVNQFKDPSAEKVVLVVFSAGNFFNQTVEDEFTRTKAALPANWGIYNIQPLTEKVDPDKKGKGKVGAEPLVDVADRLGIPNDETKSPKLVARVALKVMSLAEETGILAKERQKVQNLLSIIRGACTLQGDDGLLEDLEDDLDDFIVADDADQSEDSSVGEDDLDDFIVGSASSGGAAGVSAANITELNRAIGIATRVLNDARNDTSVSVKQREKNIMRARAQLNALREDLEKIAPSSKRPIKNTPADTRRLKEMLSEARAKGDYLREDHLMSVLEDLTGQRVVLDDNDDDSDSDTVELSADASDSDTVEVDEFSKRTGEPRRKSAVRAEKAAKKEIAALMALKERGRSAAATTTTTTTTTTLIGPYSDSDSDDGGDYRLGDDLTKYGGATEAASDEDDDDESTILEFANDTQISALPPVAAASSSEGSSEAAKGKAKSVHFNETANTTVEIEANTVEVTAPTAPPRRSSRLAKKQS